MEGVYPMTRDPDIYAGDTRDMRVAIAEGTTTPDLSGLTFSVALLDKTGASVGAAQAAYAVSPAATSGLVRFPWWSAVEAGSYKLDLRVIDGGGKIATVLRPDVLVGVRRA